jgi:hypothetical protein
MRARTSKPCVGRATRSAAPRRQPRAAYEPDRGELVIVNLQQLEPARTAIARAEVRERLIEFWTLVFEAELRADLRDAPAAFRAAVSMENAEGRAHAEDAVAR